MLREWWLVAEIRMMMLMKMVVEFDLVLVLDP